MTKKLAQIQDYFRHLLHPRRSNNHRAKLLHPDSLFLTCMVVGSLVLLLHGLNQISFFDRILGYASNITADQVVIQTNQIREQNGLKPLIVNQTLSAAATAKAANMFDKQYWAHVAPDGTEPWYFMKQAGYSYVVAGENLARDFADTPGMMAAWMDSPTHKANIINGKYNEIGVAVVDGKLLGGETTLVVQMFGTRGTAAISSNASSTQAEKMAQVKGAVEKEAEAEIKTEPVTVIDDQEISQPKAQESEVLASALLSQGKLQQSPLFSPLALSKALILLAVILIGATLAYDLLVIGHLQTMRLVGQNTAHIILLLLVSFLVIFFKAGAIG